MSWYPNGKAAVSIAHYMSTPRIDRIADRFRDATASVFEGETDQGHYCKIELAAGEPNTLSFDGAKCIAREGAIIVKRKRHTAVILFYNPETRRITFLRRVGDVVLKRH